MSIQFETIHAASLALAIAADALNPYAVGVPHYDTLDEGDLDELTTREGGFERRPTMRSPNFKAARQTCLRILREDYEAGRLSFEQLLDRYQYVEATARALAWHRWSEATGVVDALPLADDEHEVVTHERIGWHGDKEVMARPVREDWWAYEDHGFRPLRPVGDCLGFGGVA